MRELYPYLCLVGFSSSASFLLFYVMYAFAGPCQGVDLLCTCCAETMTFFTISNKAKIFCVNATTLRITDACKGEYHIPFVLALSIISFISAQAIKQEFAGRRFTDHEISTIVITVLFSVLTFLFAFPSSQECQAYPGHEQCLPFENI